MIRVRAKHRQNLTCKIAMEIITVVTAVILGYSSKHAHGFVRTGFISA